MKIVVFGLTVIVVLGQWPRDAVARPHRCALAALGHRVVFFERDVPYYALNRDLNELPGGELVLYADWDEVRARARARAGRCGRGDGHLLLPGRRRRRRRWSCEAPRPLAVFYDLDTPVTLGAARGRRRQRRYIGPRGLGALRSRAELHRRRARWTRLRDRLGARRVAPLYGHVDPDVHRPAAPGRRLRCRPVLSRHLCGRTGRPALETLLHRAGAAPAATRRFVIGGRAVSAGFPLDATTSTSCAICRRPSIRPSSPRRG